MLARRFFGSTIGPSAPAQSLRTATSWASPCRTPPTSLSTESKPQTSGRGKPSGGRSKPRSTTVQVRPRPSFRFRPTTTTSHTFFNSTPSSLHSDISRLISTLTSPSPSLRKTQGRRRRSTTSTSASPPRIPKVGLFSQVQIPLPSDYSFRPIPLYPLPLHLHMAFTPSHQPIMANMGTGRYLQPPSKRSSIAASFDPPAAPSPLRALRRGSIVRDTTPSGMPVLSNGSTSLADHLSVTSALAHPMHHHHLVSPPSEGYLSEDPETQLLRMMAEADVTHTLKAEWAFDAAMAKLGDGEAKKAVAVKEGEVVEVSNASEGDKEEIARALEGLDGVLARLALDGQKEEKKGVKVEVKVIKIGGDGNPSVEDLGQWEDIGVMLDSVKRKRKKKISKHKYQKRRKATRAQRKRLGK